MIWHSSYCNKDELRWANAYGLLESVFKRKVGKDLADQDGAYHSTLIADPAFHGKWQPEEEVVFLLVFEGDLLEGSTPGSHAQYTLTSRLAEALSIPLLEEWAEALWEVGLEKEMISELITAGECLLGYSVSVSEASWADILSRLIKEQMVKIG